MSAALPTYKPADFTSRWRITGTLTTQSLLHIGSGDTITRDGVTAEDASGNKTPVLIKSVARGHANAPCIPGASLRGVLRSRLWDACLDVAQRLFGDPISERTQRTGNSERAGQLIVHDALCTAPVPETDAPHLPFYDPAKGTAVIARTAISRRTRTVAPQKLFHHEVVPAGAVFEIEIMAENAAVTDINFLLRALLDGFRIGADTGDGLGQVRFQPDKIEALAPNDVRAWVAAGNPHAPLKWRDLTQSCLTSANPAGCALPAAASVSFPLTLNFSGFFLTKDPDRSRKPDNGDPQVALTRRTAQDKVLLPASSVRGVLRSHAERILRTLGLPAGDPTGKQPVSADWDPASGLTFTARDLAARMFGAPGWKSPIEITDFTGTGPEATHEMVAIDRFTGSVAGSRKFTTKAIWAPVLTGHITICEDRWKTAACAAWAPGLLALVLRDLAEGDLHFGMGAAKGYGHCTADLDPATIIPGVDVTASLKALRDLIPAAANT